MPDVAPVTSAIPKVSVASAVVMVAELMAIS
jgi:hypothetical protein